MGAKGSRQQCLRQQRTIEVDRNEVPTSKVVEKNRITVRACSKIEEEQEDMSSKEHDTRPAPLSIDQKALIKSTWAYIEEDAERVGPMTFINLFEMHPTMKDEFIPFKSIEVNDARFNKVLRNHGLKVLNTVRKMVNRLDEEDKMVEMVEATGTRHCSYQAEASLIDVMCPHFVKAIEGSFGDRWNPDVEEAYRHLFLLLAYHMKKALVASQKENKQTTIKKG